VGPVVVFSVGFLVCCGLVMGAGASRSILCSNGLRCLFPVMSLGSPCFMVVGVALVVSSQSSIAGLGALRRCRDFGGF
jgi:hypothetical protein